MHNSGLAGGDGMIMVSEGFLILVYAFEDFPSGKFLYSEVSATVNGASRQRCIDPWQGQTRGASGGLLSLLS